MVRSIYVTGMVRYKHLPYHTSIYHTSIYHGGTYYLPICHTHTILPNTYYHAACSKKPAVTCYLNIHTCITYLPLHTHPLCHVHHKSVFNVRASSWTAKAAHSRKAEAPSYRGCPSPLRSFGAAPLTTTKLKTQAKLRDRCSDLLAGQTQSSYVERL